jgi:RNA polymerase sigma-70 factor (ECF subfamily)
VGDSRLDTLVAEARTGADGALTELYREFHPALVGFLAGLVAQEAEDLAAETWIDVARYLARFEGDGADFRRLLFTVARRRAIDHGRKRHRRRTDVTDRLGRAVGPSRDDPAQVVADTDASRNAIAQIRSLLPLPQAEVVLLRVVAGLSVSEVAAVVNRTPAAVSVLQTRGLQRLAVKLGSRPSFDPAPDVR